MANIKNPEVDRLAQASVELKEALLAIGKRCAALPDRDTRSPDDILGYDNLTGLPSHII